MKGKFTLQCKFILKYPGFMINPTNEKAIFIPELITSNESLLKDMWQTYVEAHLPGLK